MLMRGPKALLERRISRAPMRLPAKFMLGASSAPLMLTLDLHTKVGVWARMCGECACVRVVVMNVCTSAHLPCVGTCTSARVKVWA